MKPKAHDAVEYTFKDAYRVAYPVFTEAQMQVAFKRPNNKTKDFGGHILIPKSQNQVITEITQICKDVARQGWPEAKFSTLRFPIQDGDELAAKAQGKKDWAKGHVVLKVKSPRLDKDQKLRRPPSIRSLQALSVTIKEPDLTGMNDEQIRKIADSQVPQSGSYMGGMVSFKGTPGNDDNIKDGVTCYINDVVYVREGERIGGKDYASAYESFKGVVGHTTAENPITGETAAEDDDII